MDSTEVSLSYGDHIRGVISYPYVEEQKSWTMKVSEAGGRQRATEVSVEF